MADIIQLLPDHVANQIAAGEVVQRPSSVVKELLENAIDADAKHIQLIIKEAGKTLIQVIDDGKGMSDTDARLSFERHATSKIKSAEDLFNLHTKGFRGEALASIAAIAHVELKTKPQENEIGTAIIIEGTKVISQDVAATPTGTSIAVKNLFFNIPARRNFLKSNTVETRHIIDEFHRVALAHPNLEFVMYHNGSEVFNLPSSNYRQRIVNIFGTKTNEKLVPVNENTDVLDISGFVGKPEYAKKSRGEQFFFVNNRFIKSAYLNHAISSAFDGLLKDGAHASYFLNLTVDPQTIDINIHPTKTEVKFEDEQTLYALLRSAVKHSLGQFSIAPVLDFDRDSNLDTPYNFASKNANSPTIEVDRTFNPFQSNKGQVSNVSPHRKEITASWEGLYVGLESKGTKTNSEFSEVQFESDEDSGSLFKDDTEVEQQQSTSQLRNKYIISHIKSGLLLIDQNRAHQRILYEDYLQQMTVKEAVSQQLLFPIQLHFSVDDMKIIEQLKSDLESTGFEFTTIDVEYIEIKGIPSNLPENQVASIFEDLIGDVKNEVPDTNFSATDMMAKSMSKSLAIKTGQSLNYKEQEHLVNRLFGCKEPNISPDNKPTFITVTMEEIDRKF